MFPSEDIWTLLCLMLMSSQPTYESWWRERLVFSYYIGFESRVNAYQSYSVDSASDFYELPTVCTNAEKVFFHTCSILHRTYTVELLTRRYAKPSMKSCFLFFFLSLSFLIPPTQCTIIYIRTELASCPRLDLAIHNLEFVADRNKWMYTLLKRHLECHSSFLSSQWF